MKKSPLSTTKSQSKSPAKKSQPSRISKLSKAKAQMLPVNMFCLHQWISECGTEYGIGEFLQHAVQYPKDTVHRTAFIEKARWHTWRNRVYLYLYYPPWWTQQKGWWWTDIATCAKKTRKFQDLTWHLTQTWPASRPQINDVWQVPCVYVACGGMTDLGNGPNKPTATIIGEYSTSYHDGALTSTWFRVRISGSDQNLAKHFGHTHHWLSCKCPPRACPKKLQTDSLLDMSRTWPGHGLDASWTLHQ